jgi:hypothetical protein
VGSKENENEAMVNDESPSWVRNVKMSLTDLRGDVFRTRRRLYRKRVYRLYAPLCAHVSSFTHGPCPPCQQSTRLRSRSHASFKHMNEHRKIKLISSAHVGCPYRWTLSSAVVFCFVLLPLGNELLGRLLCCRGMQCKDMSCLYFQPCSYYWICS